jgi:hypothetical protein
LVGVGQWAELRREHFVRGVSIKALARRTGFPFKDEIAGCWAMNPGCRAAG